jgi:hypothetical protein
MPDNKYRISVYRGLSQISDLPLFEHISFFQSNAYFECYKGVINSEPFIITLWNESKILGYLMAVTIFDKSGLLQTLSARTVIYGGPVICSDTDASNEITGFLLQELIAITGRKSVFIEFRNLFDLDDKKSIFEKYSFKKINRLGLILDTSDRLKLLKGVSPSKLRQIHKALELGVVVHEAQNEDEVASLYDILLKLYQKKIRKPLPDRALFINFFRQSKVNGTGVILLVKFNSKVIGGIVCPITPGKEIFEWYIGALTKEYKHLYPGVMATWAGIDYAMKNNIPKFNFMGIGSPDKPYGVRDFKLTFGGEVNEYGRYIRINNRLLYYISLMGYKLLGYRT